MELVGSKNYDYVAGSWWWRLVELQINTKPPDSNTIDLQHQRFIPQIRLWPIHPEGISFIRWKLHFQNLRKEKYVPNGCVEEVPRWLANFIVLRLVKSNLRGSRKEGNSGSAHLWKMQRCARGSFSECFICSQTLRERTKARRSVLFQEGPKRYDELIRLISSERPENGVCSEPGICVQLRIMWSIHFPWPISLR